MNTLFAQSIAQFAPLRAFARMHIPRDYCGYTQLIRDLFPKALFHEHNASRELLFEIAWSFLSQPQLNVIDGWHKISGAQHRIGGLPAVIRDHQASWYCDGLRHRDDKDSRTGLTFPAEIWNYDINSYEWYTNGKMNRTDKDARTGLTLPATITRVDTFIWWKNGNTIRNERDPITGSALSALIDVMM